MAIVMCRLCLDLISCSTSCVDIFAPKNVHLIRQLYSITGVQLINIDGQPRHMCDICLLKLKNAIKFRQRCILSQKQFAIKQSTEKVECDTINFKDENFVEYDASDQDIIEEIAAEGFIEDSDSQIDDYFTTTKETEVEKLNKQTQVPNFQLPIEQPNYKKVPKNQSQFDTFFCDECGRTLSTKSSFREHKLRHAAIKKFICKYCRKCFTTHTELTRHTRAHIGERPYNCTFCTSRFGDLSTLRQHERRHNNTRPYTCTVCQKSFISLSCLCKHRLVHQLVPRNHHCPICDLWFQRSDHLTAHLNSRNHNQKMQAQNSINLIR